MKSRKDKDVYVLGVWLSFDSFLHTACAPGEQEIWRCMYVSYEERALLDKNLYWRQLFGV